jgi:hypothetical protein
VLIAGKGHEPYQEIDGAPADDASSPRARWRPSAEARFRFR